MHQTAEDTLSDIRQTLMTIIELRDALFYCWIINVGFLLWWWLWLAFAHDWVHRVHTGWTGLSISQEKFDSIHYAGLAMYKIVNVVFFFVPWIALHIIA